jgi:hypothetical protein
MNEGRRAAINNEQEKTKQGGQGRYNYVDVKVLERLGISRYKMVTGDNFLRIISPPDLTKFYGREIFIHTKIGADGVTILCMNKMFGEPCAVCEYREKLAAAGMDADTLKALSWSRRYLFFVIDTKNESTEDEGLRWFDAPAQVKDNIVTLSKNKRTGENVDVSDPEHGRDIEFVRTGAKLQTRYSAFALIDNNPIPKEWYQDVPEFDDVLFRPTYSKVKELIQGAESTEEVEQADTPAPAGRRRSRRSEQPKEEVEVADTPEPVKEEAAAEPVKEEAEVVEGEQEKPTGRRSRRSREAGKEASTGSANVKSRLDEIRAQHQQKKEDK